MTEGSGQPKRTRGRPRMLESEKKRRNMTFRMRDDLRAAVERIADENGRSLSEQVEFFVEQCVLAYAQKQYEFSHLAPLPSSREAVPSRTISAVRGSVKPELAGENYEQKQSILKAISSEIGKLYDDLCERIESGTVAIENDNKRLREELKIAFEGMAAQSNKAEKSDQ